MAPIGISLLAFILALAGIFLGCVMQRNLPESQLTSDSKEVIKLGMGLVATLAALVLGLLVASAKSSCDARKSEVSQITADVMLLDYLFSEYGDDAKPARVALRQAIPPVVERIWKEGRSVSSHAEPFKPVPEGETFYQRVQNLHPVNDTQRGLQERIVQATNDLTQTRFLLFSHLRSSIPRPFLAVLLLWVTVLFAGFSLMAPAKATILASLVVCALSVSGAIFLILELDQPFAGIMMIPSEPLRNALLPLNH
jgi:hypothetical protein